MRARALRILVHELGGTFAVFVPFCSLHQGNVLPHEAALRRVRHELLRLQRAAAACLQPCGGLRLEVRPQRLRMREVAAVVVREQEHGESSERGEVQWQYGH